MQFTRLFSSFRLPILFLLCGLCAYNIAGAQAPTSLSYPSSNVYIANVSNVYLSPNVAGNVTSYSINPALPAGLSFNTNTGVISGVATAASVATTYTVTATGGSPSGNTNTTLSITVTNNYFNNSYSNINFGGGSGATLVTISPKVGTGSAAGDVVLYENVAQLSGQRIDCIIKTRTLTNVTTFNSFDQPLVTDGSTFNSNDPRYFSPQFTFGASGGSAIFDFQFILGGTFDAGTNSGLPAVLQNVRINTYDIDGNGAGGSNQFNEFGGFSTSEVSSGTTLQAPAYSGTTGLTRYTSNTPNNNMTVTADATRVRVTYDNISNFSIQVGGGATGAAYFFLDFGAGPAFSSAMSTQAPSIDLNTSVIGVNNGAAGCASALSFSAAAQTNAAASGNLDQLSVSFPLTAIQDAANELLQINGATSGGSIPLNANASGSVTLNGTTYTITGSSTATVRTITFTTGGAFTLALVEELLDALRYNNTATIPSAGSRSFTVNVRNTAFKSPDAIFTADMNCVSISGNIYHDRNGLTDNTINANGAQFTANQVYAVLVDPATDLVKLTQGVSAGGAYTFGRATPGAYAIYVSNSAPALNSSFTAATYPSGTSGAYKSVGENLGSASGNDLLANGKLLVTIGSSNIASANFGIQLPPVTAGSSIGSIPNPRGYNYYSIPNGSFNATDEDGSISSITITSFPTGANYLAVGSTIYISGGTCPPQSSCTAWPGTLTVPFTSGNPTNPIMIDPTGAGAAAVSIPFTALDNGGLVSGSSTLSLSFVVPASPLSISGDVWNDFDGNGSRNGSEALTAVAGSGQTLYAVLVQTSNTYSGAPTILSASAVSATTGYSFTEVPASNSYEVRIVSQAAAPVMGEAATSITPALAPGWTAVSTTKNGVATTGLNTSNPSISFTNLAASQSGMSFGIERMPTATAANYTIASPLPASVLVVSTANAMASLAATDPEQGALGSGSKVVINSIAGMNGNVLLYNGSTLGNGAVINSYDPALLSIRFNGIGSSSASFTFSIADAANVQNTTPAAFTINWGVALPVKLISFDASPENAGVALSWKTAHESDMKSYTVQHSADGINWSPVATLPATGDGTYTARHAKPVSGANYYRLQMNEQDGAHSFSAVRSLMVNGNTATQIAVYPNPVSSTLTINAATANASGTILILDATGRVVATASLQGHATTIDMSTLPQGLYLVRVSIEGGATEEVRVIKQ